LKPQQRDLTPVLHRPVELAKENGQIRSPDCRPGAWHCGSSRHRKTFLCEGRESGEILRPFGVHLGNPGLGDLALSEVRSLWG
jgi:hypothetical protein